MQDKELKDYIPNDHSSFKVIFKSLYPAMCLYATRFVSNRELAEDVSQEAFIELWRQRERFESFNQVKAFLYLTIKNRCLNIFKHQKVEENYKNEMQYTEADTDAQLIGVEVVNQLTNAIELLPEQQRQVIVLSMQGMKNEEIAEAMRISVNTVKLYKKLAYQHLRSKVGSSPVLLLLF